MPAVEHQLVRLMPEKSWNVKDEWLDEWLDGEPLTSAEDEIHRSLREMVAEDVQAGKTPGGRSLVSGGGVPDAMLEHLAVDETMELAVYKPLFRRHDALISAVRDAFNHHRPLVLTPDLVYGYLAKGIALHINTYPEQLRGLYVTHQGKKELSILDNSFVPGDKNNDWPGVFEQFSQQLGDNTNANSFVQTDLEFSTSTAMTRAHRHALNMEGMQAYFTYKLSTRCGVAAVILEGSEDDWALVRDVITKQLSEINGYCARNDKSRAATLDWWSPLVEEMLSNILLTYREQATEGRVSWRLQSWWGRIYKYHGGFTSGSPCYVTGWINIFYPYLKDESRNQWVTKHSTTRISSNRTRISAGLAALRPRLARAFTVLSAPTDGVDERDFRSYVAAVPFTWDYMGDVMKMRALIGYAVEGIVSIKDGVYPYGTIKVFPALAIRYENLQDTARHLKR